MNNLPNLPTDNLYKFKVILGLVLVVYSTHILFNERDSFSDEMHRLEIQEKLIELKNQSNLLNKNKANFQIQKEIIEFEADIKKLLMKFNYLKFFIIAYMVLFPLGGVFIFSGFWGWYHKHQKYKDLILKSEADKLSKTNL